jgi:hypothetical protein
MPAAIQDRFSSTGALHVLEKGAQYAPKEKASYLLQCLAPYVAAAAVNDAAMPFGTPVGMAVVTLAPTMARSRLNPQTMTMLSLTIKNQNLALEYPIKTTKVTLEKQAMTYFFKSNGPFWNEAYDIY